MDFNDFHKLDKNTLLIRLNDLLKKTKGFEVNERLEWLDYCLFILIENYKSLETFSLYTGQQSVANEMFANRDYTTEVHATFARHLYNFLLSSQSLVEHTRLAMRKWYLDTEMLTKYQDDINKTFIDDPLSEFIKALRNHCTHRSQVSLIIQTFPGKDSDCTKVFIHKESLLGWSKLSKRARSYVEQYDDGNDNIPIILPINEYKDKVVQFRERLRRDIVSFHVEDIQNAKWFIQAIKYVEEDDITSLIRSFGVSVRD